jgi:hypothetical protein
VAQLASIDNGTNPNCGRNILFRRNIYQNVQRTGIETGGDDDDGNGNGQVFTNFVIDNNWFVDLVFPPGDGAGPVFARQEVLLDVQELVATAHHLFEIPPISLQCWIRWPPAIYQVSASTCPVGYRLLENAAG